MILIFLPAEYTRFVEEYNNLVHKSDSVVAYTVFSDAPTFIKDIKIVFDGHPSLRMDLSFNNGSITVTTFLTDFPQAIFQLAGMGNGI